MKKNNFIICVLLSLFFVTPVFAACNSAADICAAPPNNSSSSTISAAPKNVFSEFTIKPAAMQNTARLQYAAAQQFSENSNLSAPHAMRNKLLLGLFFILLIVLWLLIRDFRKNKILAEPYDESLDEALNLARGYLELGEAHSAKPLLAKILKHGNKNQCAEALELQQMLIAK